MEIFSYFDLRTNHNTAEHFSRLSWGSTVVTLFATTVATVITLPFLGCGGWATLRFMAEWLDPAPKSQAAIANQVYQNVMNPNQPRNELNSLWDQFNQGLLDSAGQLRLVELLYRAEAVNDDQIPAEDGDSADNQEDDWRSEEGLMIPNDLSLTQPQEIIPPGVSIHFQKLLSTSIEETLQKTDKSSRIDKCAQNFYKNLEIELKNIPSDERNHLLSIISNNEALLGCLNQVVKEQTGLSLLDDSKTSLIELENQEISKLQQKLLGEPRKLFLINNLSHLDLKTVEGVLKDLEDKKAYPEQELKEIISIIVHQYYKKCKEESLDVNVTVPTLQNYISFFQNQKVKITERGFNNITKYSLAVPEEDDEDIEEDSEESDLPILLDMALQDKQHQLAIDFLKKAVLIKITDSFSTRMDLRQFIQVLRDMNTFVVDLDNASSIRSDAVVTLQNLMKKFLSDQHEFDQELLNEIQVLYKRLAEKMDAIVDPKTYEFQKVALLIQVNNFNLEKFDLDMFENMLKKIKVAIYGVDQGFVYQSAQLVFQNLILKLEQHSKILDPYRLNNVIKPLYDEIAAKLGEEPLQALRPDGRSWEDPNAEKEYQLDLEALELAGFRDWEINLIMTGDSATQRNLLNRLRDPAFTQYWMNRYPG